MGESKTTLPGNRRVSAILAPCSRTLHRMWMKSSAGSGKMIVESIQRQSDAALGFPQRSAAPPARVRFWRPAPEPVQEFSCAYLDGGCAAPHVHEEWQFAVAMEPCSITLGAYRRSTAHASEITVVAPY